MRHLDPDAVQAFVLVADLRSFTRAAQVLNSTQSAVSLKLRRLEQRMGQRLLERTPRSVKLSSAGTAFIAAARRLVEAHQEAVGVFEAPQQHLRVGFSHHIVGLELPRLLARLAHDRLTLDLRIGATRDLLDRYDAGDLDAVMVLRHDESRRDGETILRERFVWVAAPGYQRPAGPLPLATQAEPCHLRGIAVECLKTAGIAWREAFVGTGVVTVGAAAAAGLGVAALVHRVAPAGTEDVGERLGLPRLPQRDLVLHSRIGGQSADLALRSLVAATRASQHAYPASTV